MFHSYSYYAGKACYQLAACRPLISVQDGIKVQLPHTHFCHLSLHGVPVVGIKKADIQFKHIQFESVQLYDGKDCQDVMSTMKFASFKCGRHCCKGPMGHQFMDTLSQSDFWCPCTQLWLLWRKKNWIVKFSLSVLPWHGYYSSLTTYFGLDLLHTLQW